MSIQVEKSQSWMLPWLIPQGLKLAPWWIWPGLLFFLLVSLRLRLAVVQASYELDSINQELQKELLLAEKVNLEWSTLRSRANLERLAKERYRFVPPPLDAYSSPSASKKNP